MRPFFLSIRIPGGRAFSARCRTARHAAMALRMYAARRGVSVLSLDWSVERFAEV